MAAAFFWAPGILSVTAAGEGIEKEMYDAAMRIVRSKIRGGHGDPVYPVHRGCFADGRRWCRSLCIMNILHRLRRHRMLNIAKMENPVWRYRVFESTLI